MSVVISSVDSIPTAKCPGSIFSVPYTSIRYSLIRGTGGNERMYAHFFHQYESSHPPSFPAECTRRCCSRLSDTVIYDIPVEAIFRHFSFVCRNGNRFPIKDFKNPLSRPNRLKVMRFYRKSSSRYRKYDVVSNHCRTDGWQFGTDLCSHKTVVLHQL